MDEQQIRLQIIRAVNFSLMNYDKLKKLAIQENTTCGEVYYRLKQENQLNQIFSLKDQDK